MRKISSTSELQHELQKLIDYAQSDRPSRTRLAAELTSIGQRLEASHHKQAAPRLDISVESDLDEALDLLLRVKGALADTASSLENNEGSFIGNPSFTRAYQGAMHDVIEAQNALSRAKKRFA